MPRRITQRRCCSCFGSTGSIHIHRLLSVRWAAAKTAAAATAAEIGQPLTNASPQLEFLWAGLFSSICARQPGNQPITCCKNVSNKRMHTHLPPPSVDWFCFSHRVPPFVRWSSLAKIEDGWMDGWLNGRESSCIE